MRELGDFQTPPALVAAVLDALGPIGARWSRVLEPTCGRGHFLAALLTGASPPREVIGIEIQHEHAAQARRVAGSRGDVIRASLFDIDLRRDLRWDEKGPLLVVGNPPWITSAELGLLGSDNGPRRQNIKSAKGLDARTGAANFDIAEAIWLKLIDELADERPTVALLCKTAVARAVLAHARERGVPIGEAAIHRIDAGKWFCAAVDACLLRIRLGSAATELHIPVYADLGMTATESTLRFAEGGLVADADAYATSAYADGRSPVTWRQGIKHDAAAVMELVRDRRDGGYRNGLDEVVDIESDYVFPLLKGRDLARGAGPQVGRAVIVTQRSLGEDTTRLEAEAPRLWAYLGRHATQFNRRKSSIYRGRPAYSLFGVGPYTFAPYKVAVSGLHKSPRFRAYGPADGRPQLCDDTCYFLPFQTARAAALAAALLEQPPAQQLVRALLFRDAKRPVTKRLLQRIDLSAILDRADRESLLECADQRLAELDGDAATREPWPDELARLLVDCEFPQSR